MNSGLGSDGCSGPVEWFYRKILHRSFPRTFCCDEHDLAYDEGVTWRDKCLADWRFFRCIWDDKAYFQALLFYSAVTIFGWPYWWAAARYREEAERTAAQDKEE